VEPRVTDIIVGQVQVLQVGQLGQALKCLIGHAGHLTEPQVVQVLQGSQLPHAGVGDDRVVEFEAFKLGELRDDGGRGVRNSRAPQ
jgi:hypothetical protein